MVGKHLKPGDTLVMVDRWRRSTVSTETVEKVGRVWVTMRSGRRCSVETLEGEDRSWIFYLDMAHCDNHRELARLWSEFRHLTAQRYDVPNGVTKEKIHQAAQTLGLA